MLDEVGDVVNNTSHSDEAAARFGLVDIIIPLHDRELVKRNAPVELGALLVEFLLLLLNATFLDLVRLELLQVKGETELLPNPDGPFGGVILVPFDGIAVIRRELVVEVVITLTESDKCSDDMVARRVAVVKWLVTKPMCERVDAESGLLDKEDAQDATIDEATLPVAPAEAGHEHGEDETHEEDNLEVVLVLPDHDWILIEIGDVGTANSLGVLLHQHPAEVRIHKTLANRVWVLVGISVSVMSTMITSPPSDGAFDSTTTDGCEEDSKRKSGGVGSVCPEAMVASCDAETGREIVCYGPDGGLELERNPPGLDEAVDGDGDDEDDIEPVDVLVPIRLGDRRLCDVWLLGVIFGVSVWLVGSGHGGRHVQSPACGCMYEVDTDVD